MNESIIMSNRLKPINPNEPIRALSLDGGGIYGLTTAILLRRLCEQDQDFLRENQVYLFSGTSAGAINALLLAQERSPRDAVLKGKLEAFWQDPRVYASHINQRNFYNPMSWIKEYYSNMGIGSWFASEPFRELLTETFGTKPLSKLYNKVMIATFDLYGSEVNGHRQWKPKIYYNFPHVEQDNQQSIVDIAYAAGTPPGGRDIKDGKVDGGIYVPNPAVNTIAKILEQSRHYLLLNFYVDVIVINKTSQELYNCIKDSGIKIKPYENEIKKQLTSILKSSCVKLCLKEVLTAVMDSQEFYNLEHNPKCHEQIKKLLISILGEETYNYIESESLAHAIKNTQLLSVGVGDKKPAYWLKDFSLGYSQFCKYPTNPPNFNFWDPNTFLSLDAPSENSEYVCSQTIGEHYHRLNPPLFGAPDSLPTLPATFLSKNALIKELVIEQIKCKTESDTAKQAINKTLKYLQCWTKEPTQQTLEEIKHNVEKAQKLKAELQKACDKSDVNVEIAQIDLFLAEQELRQQQLLRQKNSISDIKSK